MATLSQQVEDLACKKTRWESLCGEMFATIKLNVERGYLVAVNDQGKLNLEGIIANWQKQMDRINEHPY